MLRGLDAEESGLLSSFNQKMRDFNTEFKRNRYVDKDAYYIFLIKGSGSSRAGFMPFKRQFGYVFVEHARDLATTIAHELGHGAFNLRHTFSEFPGVAQGASKNLMDYSDGQELKKYQWDNVHDPESVIGWLEDDEEGAAWMPCFGFFDDCDDVLKKLEAIKQAYEHRNTISGKIPYSASRKVLNAKNVRIEGVDYPLISIHYMGDADTEYTLDPAVNDDIDEIVYSHYGGNLVQNGIAFFQDERIIVKLLLQGDKNEPVQKKRSTLRLYLYGDSTSALLLKRKIEEALEKQAFEASDFKSVRALIEALDDDGVKVEFYLALQEKVPYRNQRDNESVATDEDVENNSSWLKSGMTAGDIMCNLTGLAMCLEHLGIACPEPNIQFEDYLEAIRREEELPHRTEPEAREELAKKFGVEMKKKELNTNSKVVLITVLKPELERGNAVLLSAFPVGRGHIVRLQAITDDGLVVDDPYGKVQSFIERDEGGFGYSGGKNSADSKSVEGEDNLWRWSDIEQTIIKYAEIYRSRI